MTFELPVTFEISVFIKDCTSDLSKKVLVAVATNVADGCSKTVESPAYSAGSTEEWHAALSVMDQVMSFSLAASFIKPEQLPKYVWEEGVYKPA